MVLVRSLHSDQRLKLAEDGRENDIPEKRQLDGHDVLLTTVTYTDYGALSYDFLLPRLIDFSHDLSVDVNPNSISIHRTVLRRT